MPSDQNLGISWLSQLGQPVTNSAEGVLSFERRMGGAGALRDLDSTWGVGGPVCPAVGPWWSRWQWRGPRDEVSARPRVPGLPFSSAGHFLPS